ncbi:oxidoreductase [Pseudovirgaria hyperparasitica]|uniref:mRNA N(6)-methyladenine demethylase n=1 Tax=Pseudovirgaria hyperparasitica TaxID=470096 RepID=A0A6A6WBM7_9PEZI|nr:oxidoreductase [Pseudovirgaria hyperparasitica]KAF2760232.1 oxidoreductase [Pseudovirgaria hyperparasitica]
MDALSGLDAHQKPPEDIRLVYKSYQKMKVAALDWDENLLDFKRELSKTHKSKVKVLHTLDYEHLQGIFQQFTGEVVDVSNRACEKKATIPASIPVYEHDDCPGLRIIPSAIPLSTQRVLLDRLLHRDLVNPRHMTNVHLHHHLIQPASGQSFFSLPPEPVPVYRPKDPAVHGPLTLESLLNRKLRWVTLGGQYDWTRKRYPTSEPPPFPDDIARLLRGLCPDILPEAAICNLYTPGDTLSLHRDVSEQCAAPLLSLSIGCDAIFILSALKDRGTPMETTYPPATIKLHSGDIVVMSGPSRFAWHGIPKVIADTCPEALSEWPSFECDSTSSIGVRPFSQWSGWLKRKRINLNVRQMFAGE